MIVIKSDVMNIVDANGLVYLEFKALKDIDFVKQATSTRIGGVSAARGLESLNLGTYTADSPDNVRKNYLLFCTAAGFDEKKLVLGNQSHSLNVRYATPGDCGKGIFTERDYTDVDALVTDYKNLPLVIHTADCVPVLFVDTVKKVIGAAHCGWRGTYGELARLTLEAMKTRFSSQTGDIVCTLGPCICQKCYEVSYDLFQKFCDKFGHSSYLVENDGSCYIDLAGINKQILENMGVKTKNIHISDLCTSCNKDYLYSHRGQGPERGIFSTVLELV